MMRHTKTGNFCWKRSLKMRKTWMLVC